MVAADKLLLQELVEYLQKYLIEKKSEWTEQHFELAHKASFQSNNLLELRQFCTNLMAKSPEKIFKSLDFTSLPEKSLISIIKRDDLQMKEVEVWEYVLKWGLAQNPTLIPDPDTWTDNDFNTMENTLRHCLPFIRFFSLSSKDISQKVRPYKRLLNQLYEDLVISYMDPDSVPNKNVLLPRKGSRIIDSTIVNINIASLISRWIDKVDVDINSKFFHLRELYLPYEFKLLLRGSRDGFTPKIFHALCDNKPMTVTFVKVKGTEEILGGYNPLIWKYTCKPQIYGETKDSFIFSFKNKDNFFNDAILSHVNNMNHALIYHKELGPCFNSDLHIDSYGILLTTDCSDIEYNNIYCKQASYEKKIRDIEAEFSIDDYEIFQIIK